MKLACIGYVILLLLILSAASYCSVSPNNVAVIVNTNPALKANPSDLFTKSQLVGQYYCNKANIPYSNIIEINTYSTESISQQQYTNLSNQIRSKLISQFGVNPDDLANDPIQVLVMCYGVPSKIEGDTSAQVTQERTSVDQFLPLLFNADPDLGPDIIDGDCNVTSHWYPGTLGVNCPYYGKDMDFATFRASADNTITYLSPKDQLTHHWKMRYLVCRLDAYDDKMVTVDGYGTMPQDVKALIDRAHDSAGQRGCFVLDEAWKFRAPSYGNTETELKKLVNSDLVFRDGDSANPKTILSSADVDFNDVMGYTSFGMHDPDILVNTTWGRPSFTWKPGAVAIIGESSGCESLRTAHTALGYYNLKNNQDNSDKIVLDTYYGSNSILSIDDDHKTVNRLVGNPILRVHLWFTENYTDIKYYENYKVKVLDNTGNVELCEPALAQKKIVYGKNDCVAEINLSSIDWSKTVGHQVNIRVYWPDDDPYHGKVGDTSSEELWLARFYEDDLWKLLDPMNNPPNAPQDGIELWVKLTRQESAEYIRNGCSATSGPVSEPAHNISNCEITFPQYVRGYTWAEAAYQGADRLGFKLLVVGDPLMAPYTVYPSVNFEPPTPDSGSNVTGHVILRASASTSPGTIKEVQFKVKDSTGIVKATYSDTQSPYEYAWDSLATIDGNRVYPDGNYVIEATAYLVNNVGTASVSRNVTLDSTTTSVSITQPEYDYAAVNSTSSITAAASGTPSSIDFWLFTDNDIIHLNNQGPNSCQIPSNIANGVCSIQAIAHYDGTTPSVAYSAWRKLVFVNNAAACTNVSQIGNLSDNDALYLINAPVVAGTSSTMDGAFYVEDSNRAAGIRVQTTQTVAAGRQLIISGILHKSGANIAERYIEAQGIWDTGTTDIPQPLRMSTSNIGGNSGITDGVGPYNTGLLIRASGKVTYVGDSFFYIGDGCNLYDGNTIPASIPVPLDGRTISTTHPYAQGLCVYCGSSTKPGIGDYVTVTGISSVKVFGSKVSPYLRTRAMDDIQPNVTYRRATKYRNTPTVYNSGYFEAKNPITQSVERLPNGSRVRLVDAYITNCFSTYFIVQHGDATIQGGAMLASIIDATTALSGFSGVTITGKTCEYDYSPDVKDEKIIADGIYIGGTNYGAFSILNMPMSYSSLSVPTRIASEDIVSSDSFIRQDTRANCIGWALAQPDGSVVDLIGEFVTSKSTDGTSFGIKETFEPSTGQPRLVINLPANVAQLAPFSTIDIIGGTLATLSNGQHAILYPQAVYVNTDAAGRRMPPMWNKQYDSNGLAVPWQWRDQVYPAQ